MNLDFLAIILYDGIGRYSLCADFKGGVIVELQFKKKEYNWGDTFYILDDNNQRKYWAKSSVLLWNRKWEICDLDKNQLVVIKNEPKSLLKKKYYISINGEDVVSITKELSPIPKFTMEGLDWQMHGVMIHEYEMLKNEEEVLSFHVESTGWGFRPVLKITNDADELLALAVVMTISYVMNAGEDGKSTNHL